MTDERKPTLGIPMCVIYDGDRRVACVWSSKEGDGKLVVMAGAECITVLHLHDPLSIADQLYMEVLDGHISIAMHGHLLKPCQSFTD